MQKRGSPNHSCQQVPKWGGSPAPGHAGGRTEAVHPHACAHKCSRWPRGGRSRTCISGGMGMSRMRPRTHGIMLGHEEEGRSDTCYHLHEPCKQDAEGGKLVTEATCCVTAFRGNTQNRPMHGGRRRRWLPGAGECWPAPGFLRDDENVLETDSGQLHVS